MRFTPKQQRQTPGSGTSPYLKVKSGESVKGVFRGEIYEWKAKWNQGSKRYDVIENSDPTLNNRFKANFVVWEEGKFVARVFEFGLSVYEQLEELSKHYANLETVKVVISRKGELTDTVWTVFPLPEGLSPSNLEAIGEAKLNILNPKQEVSQEEAYDEFGPPPTDDELPF